jgi:hypothetical protein
MFMQEAVNRFGCSPFNADEDRTCLEIMTNKQQTTRPEARSVKLPPYVEAAIRVFDIDNRSIQPGQPTRSDR